MRSVHRCWGVKLSRRLWSPIPQIALHLFSCLRIFPLTVPLLHLEGLDPVLKRRQVAGERLQDPERPGVVLERGEAGQDVVLLKKGLGFSHRTHPRSPGTGRTASRPPSPSNDTRGTGRPGGSYEPPVALALAPSAYGPVEVKAEPLGRTTAPLMILAHAPSGLRRPDETRFLPDLRHFRANRDQIGIGLHSWGGGLGVGDSAHRSSAGISSGM